MESPQSKQSNLLPASVLVAGLILAGAILVQVPAPEKTTLERQHSVGNVQNLALAINWGDLGKRLATEGVIDEARLRAIYETRGGFPGGVEAMLRDVGGAPIEVTKENAGFILNMLWALGLGNKNPILENGEMSDPRYGGAGNFASTGGWTLAVGDAMDHYSRHEFIVLSPEEQALVDRTSRNIYRPCCPNSAHFPDCNHGMAMLGLLELLASQGASEEEMYQAAVSANSYWFPGYTDTIPSAPSGSCSV